jgi:hypothetical protein
MSAMKIRAVFLSGFQKVRFESPPLGNYLTFFFI